jgi:Sec-independent protein secretion pathway component TatC
MTENSASVFALKKTDKKKQSLSLREILLKARFQLISVATSLLIVAGSSVPAKANIFNNAKTAMTCLVTSASANGGVQSAVLTALPSILFTALTIVLFGYFCFSIYQGVAAYGRGEEVSNVIQQPIFTFIAVILVVMFQTLLFGTGLC